MLSLVSTVVSFLMGGLPNILNFFQDRADKKHELEMAQLQIQRELELKRAGLEIEERIAHIQTEQIQINADVTNAQTAVQERQALYNHDIETARGASQWVVNARAMVRPGITYGMFLLLVFVDAFGFYHAWKTGVAFDIALDQLWDDDSQIVFASIISFYFGGQAFKK